MSSGHDRHGQHVYGAVHKALRKRFAARMKSGEAFYCWRPTCRTPSEPISPRSWDLGHVDPELRHVFGERWPEHPRCNRRTVSHLKERLYGKPGAPEPTFPGLPDPEPTNTVTRWSRHWYGPFNPRCPDCRKTGKPCELALRFTADEAA